MGEYNLPEELKKCPEYNPKLLKEAMEIQPPFLNKGDYISPNLGSALTFRKKDTPSKPKN